VRKKLVWLLATACLFTFTGCSASNLSHSATGSTARARAVSAASAAPVSTTRVAPASTATSGSNHPLPLDVYSPSYEQMAEAVELRLTIEGSCMRKLGFPNFLANLDRNYVGGTVRTFNEFDSRLWGITSASQADQYGYHLPPWASASEDSANVVSTLTPAGRYALYGSSPTAMASGRPNDVPVGGCVGFAERAISADKIGDVAQAAPLVASLTSDSFNDAVADPRVTRVFAQWSSCMRAEGYQYASPFSTSFNLSGPPTPVEIKTAKADISCKAKTNLLSVAYSVQRDYQDAMIKAHAKQLAADLAALKIAAARLSGLEVEYRLPS
jgi:hypothetical protein